MTNEEILEQQVEALEKLLQLKQAIINEQERKIEKLQNGEPNTSWQPWRSPNQLNPFGPLVNLPSIQTFPPCSDGTYNHAFPQLWGGIHPPTCYKCGQPATSTNIISSTTSGVITVTNAASKEEGDTTVLRLTAAINK